MSAVFSECRTWRYTLTREIRESPFRLGNGHVTVMRDGEVLAEMPVEVSVKRRTVVFIGLNPSTADEMQDDPTIRRCIGFARLWGFERLVMLNLFAYRSTDPKKLYELDWGQRVGPENDKHLYHETKAADLVVCAWGTHGALGDRGPHMAKTLRVPQPDLHVLGLTKDGHPKHPLYLRADTEPVPWIS